MQHLHRVIKASYRVSLIKITSSPLHHSSNRCRSFKTPQEEVTDRYNLKELSKFIEDSHEERMKFLQDSHEELIKPMDKYAKLSHDPLKVNTKTEFSPECREMILCWRILIVMLLFCLGYLVWIDIERNSVDSKFDGKKS